jgi:hypothetical protein
MGARTKLNAAYFTGSLIVAGLAGGVTQSWAVFAVALAVMLVSNVCLNEIRLKRPRRGHGRKRSSNHGEES